MLMFPCVVVMQQRYGGKTTPVAWSEAISDRNPDRNKYFEFTEKQNDSVVISDRDQFQFSKNSHESDKKLF